MIALAFLGREVLKEGGSFSFLTGIQMKWHSLQPEATVGHFVFVLRYLSPLFPEGVCI